MRPYTPRMAAPTRCFTYSRADAMRAFPGIGDRDLVLALLARATPPPHWDGCVVQRHEGPTDDPHQLCVGVTGPAAVEVTQLLAVAWEQIGIPIEPAPEGSVLEPLARANAGRWEPAG